MHGHHRASSYRSWSKSLGTGSETRTNKCEKLFRTSTLNTRRSRLNELEAGFEFFLASLASSIIVKMILPFIAAAAVLATAVQAHFQMQYPIPRGPFVEDSEPTFCGECNIV